MYKANILNKAIVEGNEDLVRKLLQEGAHMDHLLGMRGTALCAAISAHQTSIACLLIKSGCSVNVEDFDKEPPLFLAIRKECLSVVRELVHHPKCNINKADPLTLMPPLCFAVKMGFQEVVSWFIKARCDLLVRDAYSNTALHHSLFKSHIDITYMLVKDGTHRLCNDAGLAPVHVAAKKETIIPMVVLLSKWLKTDISSNIDVDCIQVPESSKEDVKSFVNFPTRIKNESPLYHALSNSTCKSDMVKLLLKCGANPNFSDGAPKSMSPLLLACVQFTNDTNMSLGIIEMLLQDGANTESAGLTSNSQVKTITPLCHAAKNHSLVLTEMLVKYGADVNSITSGKCALQVSLEKNALSIAWFLMKEVDQINLKICGVENRNLLHSLVHSDLKKETNAVVEYLVRRGCSVNGLECQLDKATPLHRAITIDNVALVKSLIHNGADVNYSPSGLSPLHVCAEHGTIEVARILLSAGADINAVSFMDETPIEISLESSIQPNHEMTWFLLNAGCQVPSRCFEIEIESDSNYTDSDLDSDESTTSSNEIIPKHKDKKESALLTAMKKRASGTMPLSSLCFNCLRKHYSDHSISFHKMNNLPLPSSLISILLYKF